MTVSNVTFLYRQYMLRSWMTMKYIVYLSSVFTTIQVKCILFVLAFRILYIQTLRWHQTEFLVKCTPKYLAQTIFSGKLSVVMQKFYHMLERCILIHRVKLIYIRMLSPNQNILFYIKIYWIKIFRLRFNIEPDIKACRLLLFK